MNRIHTLLLCCATALHCAAAAPPQKNGAAADTTAANDVQVCFEDFEPEKNPHVTMLPADSAACGAGCFVQPYTMPRFEGGDLTSFRRWVQQRIRVPEMALAEEPRRRAIVSFTIDTLGCLTDIRVLQTPDRLLADEAVRVLKTSPRWEPGRKYGEKTPIKYVLPVDFIAPH